ncbi:MAG: Coenzyme F420 hydrogenase/dehydrogenase, beta subunit C-terminal domain [Candidatus Bathyarchaeota archaeon]|jgi:coenzyme F420 hydrogenase subunit beta|nr:CBS domain-containing protein [Candidatus Bathyarchaeota archaeon A05DMB-5]MDH7558285.1 Coenzyme F420 hydrogenase/dehydrogenase, beta subunit C-terminal domain [Candidatus Bathyarchaeota archaeon]
MPTNKNKLIAFNDLERLIIEPEFCTLCGACEAACPIHAIKVDENKPNRLYDCSEHLDTCPICYDICPHTDALLYETLRFVVDAPFRRESLGYYRKILLAHATNPTIREATKSGGVINALLNFAINQKIIDSAIVSKVSPRLSIKVKPSVSLVPDDTLSVVDSKVVPSAVAEAFGRAVFEHGRFHIAFVGVPCHVLALRKLEAWQHKLIGSLEITIGLFCLWTFSLGRLLEYLLQEHNIAASEIQNVDLIEDKYVVTTENHTIRIPLSEVKPHIMNRCKTCTDFTSELADLSVGGAAPLKDWSIIIVRTKKGEEFLKLAVEKGIITTKEIETEPETLAHLINLSTHKRKNAMQETKTMKKKGLPIPSATEFSIKPTAIEINMLQEMKVEQIMTKNVVTLTPAMTVNELFDKIAEHHHIGFPIINESNKLAGIVTLQDAMKVAKQKRNNVSLGEICTKNLITAFPEDSLAEAFEKMNKHNIGRLLVVDKNNTHLLLGIVTRSDVMHALRTRV